MDMGGCAGGKVREGWYRWCHARICTYTRARFRENQILLVEARVQSLWYARLVSDGTEHVALILYEIFRLASSRIDRRHCGKIYRRL
jgi:hypothetical protein